MKIKIASLIILFFTFTSIAFSQDAKKDSIPLNTWVPTSVIGLNISQIALSNWTQGGDNAITWTFTLNGSLRYHSEGWKFRNNLTAAYGRTKLGSQDFRTNDNELYLESVLSKNIDWAVDPYFSNSVRTAISTGYDYGVDPAVAIAGFFDPGYVTQSLGFLYEKDKIVSTRLGIALQETFTNKYVSYSDDPNTSKIEKFKLETGIESVTNFEYTIAQNLLFQSNLRLFTRFKSMDVWDVRWGSAIVAKVNDFLNVNLTALVIYQKDQSPKTQLKQALQLGFVYTLL